MEPPRSEPCSRKVNPVASAAAAPPLEPPGVRVESHGLFVAPYASLLLCATSASMNATLVVPTMIAPAARSRSTTVASQSEIAPRQAGLPHVVGRPATWKLSLIVIGTPSNGPRR